MSEGGGSRHRHLRREQPGAGLGWRRSRMATAWQGGPGGPSREHGSIALSGGRCRADSTCSRCGRRPARDRLWRLVGMWLGHGQRLWLRDHDPLGLCGGHSHVANSPSSEYRRRRLTGQSRRSGPRQRSRCPGHPPAAQCVTMTLVSRGGRDRLRVRYSVASGTPRDFRTVVMKKSYSKMPMTPPTKGPTMGIQKYQPRFG